MTNSETILGQMKTARNHLREQTKANKNNKKSRMPR